MPELLTSPPQRQSRTGADGARMRFVPGPDRRLMPDPTGRLPSEGVWIDANRASLASAVSSGAFAILGHGVDVPSDLPDRVEALLTSRFRHLLGMARKAGWLVGGFEMVSRLAAQDRGVTLVVAADAASGGRRKLLCRARAAHGFPPVLIDLLSDREIGRALGRDRVVYAALKSCPLSSRLRDEAARMAGFRCPAGGGAAMDGSMGDA